MPAPERPDPVLDLIRSVEPPPHDVDALWRGVHSRRAEWVHTSGDRGGRNWWMRIAAALFVAILGLSATVDPIRSAAVSGVVEPVQSWTRAAVERIARVIDPPPAAVLIPANRLIRVHVDRCQETGVLRIVRSDSRAAILSVTPQEGGEHISRMSGGARVHNSAASTANYRLVVPFEVRHVALRIGRSPVLLTLASNGATAWDLYLNEPTGGQIGHCSE